VVVETGRDVAAAFNSLHSALSELQKSLGAQADQLVEQALKSARTAAEANAKAAQAGSKHPELADRRDQALRELAQVLGTKSSPDGLAAFIGGTSVVQDGWLREFGLTYSADGTQLVWLESGEAVQNVKGSLGETLRLRNEVLPAYIKQLDDLALSFANAVNELHKQGIDLDGNAGAELFFGSTAADIRINPDIASSPRKLAVSESGAPGDGGIARRIAELADTVGEQYRTMLGRLGAEVRASRERAELAETSLQTLIVQEQSVSGVSLDEELSNLIQFQRAYEAAARIVSISSELALTILRMAES
jgi:flagellar hook-associated protein 1 FlgK